MHESYMIKVVRVGKPEPSMRVDRPEVASKYWKVVIQKQAWFDEDKEHLVVLLLSTQLSIQGYSLVSVGSLNECITAPREILRAAVATGSYGIVMMHNHPSGYPWPSEDDRAVTKRLHHSAEDLQIKFLDHVIVGRPNGSADLFLSTRRGRKCRARLAADEVARRGYFSFKEEGAL